MLCYVYILLHRGRRFKLVDSEQGVCGGLFSSHWPPELEERSSKQIHELQNQTKHVMQSMWLDL